MSQIPRHSYSRINTFASECERRFFLDAMFPEKLDSPAINNGHHVHEALEFMAQLIADGATPEEAAITVKSEPPEGSLEPPQLASYIDRVVPVLGKLKPMKNGVEKWFRDVAGMPVVGKIDLVSSVTFEGKQKKLVLDWKTTGNPMRAMRMADEIRKSLQLQIYCLAEGCQDAAYVFLFPEPQSEPLVKTVHFTPKELAVAARWLRGTIDAIDSRWDDARRAAERSPKEVVEGFDPKVFSLARPGMPFCNAKWCRHWSRCLGKDNDNG